LLGCGFGWGTVVQTTVSWGTGGWFAPRRNEEEHNARARSVCLKFVPRIIKGVAAGDSWIDWRVRVTRKTMLGLPYILLLVVTARAAWFNFRGWKKRL